MSYKGYDVFYTDPDAEEEMFCKVCNTRCNVERSLTGPTGWLESMAGRGHWHDRFSCPYSGKPWHDKALEIYLEMEETSSKRVAALMQQDINDILVENGCTPASDQIDD